jgi:hypothetical protein
MPSGFVYLFKADNCLCKIGRSNDPDKRVKQFSGLPFKVTLVHRFEAYDYADYWENWLHRSYAHARVNGEWFKLTEDEILTIRSIVDTTINVNGDHDFIFECAVCRVSPQPECHICEPYVDQLLASGYSPT